MSENRNRYTSTPMSGARRRSDKESRAYRMDGTAQSPHSFLQVCLVFVLPILCLFALFGGSDALRWIFLILSIGALFFMWLGMAFVPNARKMVTVIYAVLIALVAVSIVTNRPIPDVKTDYNSQHTSADPADMQSVSAPQTAVSEPTTPMQTVSAAQLRLETLMSYWSEERNEDMLELCLPSWRNAQIEPLGALFEVIAYRVPTDYEIVSISGTDNDTNRTIIMIASINKINNSDVTNRYEFQVLMVEWNDVWYVDPESLRSDVLIPDAAATQQGVSVTFTPTPAATPTPGPTYILYYNSKGGEYYHADSVCKRVNAQYFPLATFYYKDLNVAPYKNLKPCPYCDAPARE